VGAEVRPGEVEERLVAVERTQGRNRFRAVRCLCSFRDAKLRLPEPAARALGAKPGDRLHTIPFD
jgi:arginine N-succinyltransferase